MQTTTQIRHDAERLATEAKKSGLGDLAELVAQLAEIVEHVEAVANEARDKAKRSR